MSFFGQKDLFLEIPRGKVPGLSSVNRAGRNSVIQISSTPEDIWDAGGIWVPPTAARNHNISSTSSSDAGTLVSSGTATGGSTTTIVDSGATFVSDGVAVDDSVVNDTNSDYSIVESVDSETQLTVIESIDSLGFNSGDSYRVVTPASNGASVIRIEGLDGDFVKDTEFVILNGTSTVVTVSSFYRIQEMVVAGAVNRDIPNLGDIQAVAITDSTLTAQLNLGQGMTLMAIYTVPSAHTAYVTGIYAELNKPTSGQGTVVDITLNSVNFATSGVVGRKVNKFIGVLTDGSSYVPIDFKPYRKYPSFTDIWLRVESTTKDGTDVGGGIDIILVEDD